MKKLLVLILAAVMAFTCCACSLGDLPALPPLPDADDGAQAEASAPQPEEITLDGCAALLCLNKSYLCRLFRTATGTTLWDFINFVRVCKSEEMLAENMNLSEIAYAVGFSSPSYFHRTFKKYKQCAPSEYRKLYHGIDPMLPG